MVHPLSVPPGRGGIQLTLALTYSSAGDNGWIGQGWDLSVGSVTIDTRWGVPRYRRIGDRLLAAHALHPAKELVTDELMDAARRAGREVAVWTVNEPGDMQRLAGMGVGALITDRPDIGRETVDSLGQGGARA